MFRENGIEACPPYQWWGAVYHDLNNLNYTIISKEDENKAFDFKSFSTPQLPIHLLNLGVKAEFTGRNDFEIDGKQVLWKCPSLYQWAYHAPWLLAL